MTPYDIQKALTAAEDAATTVAALYGPRPERPKRGHEDITGFLQIMFIGNPWELLDLCKNQLIRAKTVSELINTLHKLDKNSMKIHNNKGLTAQTRDIFLESFIKAADHIPEFTKAWQAEQLITKVPAR